MPVNVQSDILKHLQDQVECRFHLLNALLNHGRLLFYHVEDTTKGWRPAILTNMALLSERLSTIEDLQKSSQTNFNALLDKTNRHAQSMTKIHESLNSLDQKINDRQKTTDNQLKKISDRQKTTDDQLKKIIALLSSDEEKRSRSCSCILSTLTLTRQAIIIPIIDADNDEVRCRFDKDSAECTGVCPPNSLPNGTLILLNCALPITGSESSDWYIVAVMIEDFIESTSKDTTEQYSYSIFSSCPSNNMQSNQYYATFTVAENDVPLCPEHYDDNSTLAALDRLHHGFGLVQYLQCFCSADVNHVCFSCLAASYRKSTNADEPINNDRNQTSTSTYSLPNDAELKSPASVSESYVFGEKIL
ncbi:unnamed protein product [Adineta ricciae]|uniref:Uncharacterized protein n=1 Tax=Adineta ricciae TaxID=249248 RepID=A0A815YYP1_ADIRI|nr:unnamed protein product [Adineta ricciae]